MTSARTVVSTLIVSIGLVVLATTAGASAIPTEITQLNATTAGTQVNVSGKATFGSTDTVVVGTDGTAATDPATNPAGLNLASLSIGQPNGAKSELVFTVKLGGMDSGGVPEGAQLNWDIAVNGGAENGGANWSIKTMKQAAGVSGGTDPYAAVYSCVPSDTGYSCSATTTLTVVYDQALAEIRMTVPLNAISASPGSTIEAWGRSGQPVWFRPSASGVVTGGSAFSFDDMTHGQFDVPTKTVQLGLAPAGTPEADVTFGPVTTLSSNGSFSGSRTAPGPGTYDLWARACIADNCGSSSRQVTIA